MACQNSIMETVNGTLERRPEVGAKRALKPRQVWAIRRLRIRIAAETKEVGPLAPRKERLDRHMCRMALSHAGLAEQDEARNVY